MDEHTIDPYKREPDITSDNNKRDDRTPLSLCAGYLGFSLARGSCQRPDIITHGSREPLTSNRDEWPGRGERALSGSSPRNEIQWFNLEVLASHRVVCVRSCQLGPVHEHHSSQREALSCNAECFLVEWEFTWSRPINCPVRCGSFQSKEFLLTRKTL